MSDNTKLTIKIGLPILILIGAALLTYSLIASRKQPAREEPEQAATLVETMRAERAEHRLDVRASGEVVPARQITLQAQVSGRIVEVHPQLVPGGLVEKGETLVQIDRSDYELAVERQRTALAQAQAQLEIEKGQQEIAEREWELFRDEAEEQGQVEDPSLALRKPQLASAKAELEAARVRLREARLNLERTSIEAPFDAMVREESADVGQLAGPQGQLATLVGTEHYWVRVSIGTDKIPHIAIPNVNADEGARATVRYEVDNRTITREARVMRLLGDLDPAGRMARLLLQIDNPLGLENGETPENARDLPLLLDAYVDVVIHGDTTRELIALPRRAVRNGDEVYLLKDGQLEIRELEIAWRRPDTVLVESGVSEGDRIVVGPLPSPVEGMPLEAAENGNRKSENGNRKSENGNRKSENGNRKSDGSGDGEGEE